MGKLGSARSGIHGLRAARERRGVFAEELAEQDGQLEGGFQVAGDGDALLEKRFLGGEPATQYGRKSVRVGVVNDVSPIFQAGADVA
jgi:hypothetical protein